VARRLHVAYVGERFQLPAGVRRNTCTIGSKSGVTYQRTAARELLTLIQIAMQSRCGMSDAEAFGLVS